MQWDLNEQTAFTQVGEQRARRRPAAGDRGRGRRRPIRRQQGPFLDDAGELHRLPTDEHGERPVQGQPAASGRLSRTRSIEGRTSTKRAHTPGTRGATCSTRACLDGETSTPIRWKPNLPRQGSLPRVTSGTGRSPSTTGRPARRTRPRPQIVRQDLINIGFEPANITMKAFSGSCYDPGESGATTPTSASRTAGARTIPIRSTGSTSSWTAARSMTRTPSTTRA